VTSGKLKRKFLFVAFAVCTLAAHARAQGGPPMITDDPGTPGNGHLEANIAATIERKSDEQSWELPVLDLNYGVGERIQLNFETSFTLLKRDDHGAIGGAGTSSAAVKWRFLDEATDGISMSMYPRVEWNVLQSSVRRGLVDDGTHVLLPVQVAHRFGIADVDLEIGSRLNSVGRCEWIYGVVAATSVTSTTEVMAELNGSARTSFDRDRLTVNAGLRQKLSSHLNLITSLGTDVRTAPGQRDTIVGYFGGQLEY
jgi:hypothetical protein